MVKDEQLFLRECLQSVQAVVDELVVVDTGSGDHTVAIARAMGARVFEEPWPGDLARAHDLPLRRATGDWALTLDGDEVLDPVRGPELRDLVQNTRYDGFHFTVRNYRFRPGLQHRPAVSTDPLVHGATSWTPSSNIRLFRNRDEFCHEGRVHQSVLESMKRAGAAVATTTVPIHHYGFLRTDRDKSPLYAALAEQHASDHPNDAKAQLELGIVYLSTHRFEEAMASFERACQLGNPAEGQFFSALALVEQNKEKQAIDACLAAIEAGGGLRHFHDEADAWQLLGHAQAALGNHADAADAFRACLRLRPDSPEAEARLAAVLAACGKFDEAVQRANAVTQRYPGLALGWEASGYQALLAGFASAAVERFQRALDIDPERWSSKFNLALAFARQGDEGAARSTLSRARLTDREGRLEALGLEQQQSVTCVPPLKLGRGGVMSFIPHLSGGAAFVATELARALAPAHPQLIATLDAGDFTGEEHRQELTSLGVPLVTVRSAVEMAALQAKVEPGVLIHHFWHNPVLDTLQRSGRERLVLRSASPSPMPAGYDRYVTLSSFQEQYQRHIPAAQRERIPNGVDLERFGTAVARHELWPALDARGERPVRVAMISRLDPDKFVRRLPDYWVALQGLPVVVVIAGRGARRWEIEPELAQRGLCAWIRFVGPIAQRDVPGFLAAADVGLHLTETHQESHSLTILQMMAAGLPIVAQPRGCLPELVTHDETGFLAASETEVAAALSKLIVDRELRARLGEAARRRVAPYGAAHFARRWRNLVENLLAQAR